MGFRAQIPSMYSISTLKHYHLGPWTLRVSSFKGCIYRDMWGLGYFVQGLGSEGCMYPILGYSGFW